MEREHMRVHEENKTEAGKVRWVRPDGPDDVGGPVGLRWGRPDKDGDGRMKMGTNPDREAAKKNSNLFDHHLHEIFGLHSGTDYWTRPNFPNTSGCGHGMRGRGGSSVILCQCLQGGW